MRTCRPILAAALLSAAGLTFSACGDLDVITNSYATLDEARAAGALERGWIPEGLPPGARDIREAHDLDSGRRWGLFNFPQEDRAAFGARLGPQVSLDGHVCGAPARIEWWPVILRQRLDGPQLETTGLRGYRMGEGQLLVAVNWNQGRAYYCTPKT